MCRTQCSLSEFGDIRDWGRTNGRYALFTEAIAIGSRVVERHFVLKESDLLQCAGISVFRKRSFSLHMYV